MSMGWLPLGCAAIVVALYIWSELHDRRKMEKERREAEERLGRIENHFGTIVSLLQKKKVEGEDNHAKATQKVTEESKKASQADYHQRPVS